MPRRVPMGPGVTVDHVPAGPAEVVSKDTLFPYMDAYAADLHRQWSRRRPDVVHAHFWMSGYAALEAARSAVEAGLDGAHARAYALVGDRDPATRAPAAADAARP